MELSFANGVQEYTVHGVKGDVIIRFNRLTAHLSSVFTTRLTHWTRSRINTQMRCRSAATALRFSTLPTAATRRCARSSTGLFEEPVCDSIFGSMNLYAMADGLHVWTNFLLALMDETDSAFAREQKATNPRIQKYTAKYHR